MKFPVFINAANPGLSDIPDEAEVIRLLRKYLVEHAQEYFLDSPIFIPIYSAPTCIPKTVAKKTWCVELQLHRTSYLRKEIDSYKLVLKESIIQEMVNYLNGDDGYLYVATVIAVRPGKCE